MAKRQVFLQLTPEFGGTKFGPFQGAEIRLGSEPGRNDIVLPEGLGVAPEHARLVKQPDESFILSPVERTAQIYLYRVDGRPPKPVQSPIAVVMGDGFSLVTQEGPRFVIVLEMEKRAAGGDDKGGGALGKAKSKLNAGTLAEEIKRQGLSRALATGAGQFLGNAVTFIKSGAFLRPRYIITFMMIAAGWIFGGGALCTAGGAMWDAGNSRSDLASKDEELSDLKRSCSVDEEDVEFDPIAKMDKILKPQGEAASLWKTAFTDDPDFEQMVWTKVQEQYADIGQEPYKWVWTTKKSPFVDMATALDTAGLDKYTARVLSYAAATPSRNLEAKWLFVSGSNGAGACGRGAGVITYRQATNMKFPEIQRDAMVDADTAAGLSEDATITDDLRKKFKESTIQSDKAEIAEDEVVHKGGEVEGGSVCLFVGEADGADDRQDLTSKAFKGALGTSAEGLPKADTPFGPMARIARYFASDWAVGYETLKLEQKRSPVVLLNTAPEFVPKAQKEWAVDRMATTIARAIAIPCWAKLDKKKEDLAKRPKVLDGHLPKAEFDCVALGYYAAQK